MLRALALLSLLAAWPMILPTASAADLEALKEKVARRLPGEVSLDSLRPSKAMPGWYELEHGMQLLYISADARRLFVGDLVDLEAQVNLTQGWRERNAVRLIDAVGEENMVVMGPANAKRTITVFTDVDCPYCRRLHDDVPELTKNGVKVRYLLYPRTGLESETYRKSVAVWCAADRVKAVGVAKSGGALETKTCANPVAQHYQLGRRMNVAGTPTIYLDDGKVLGGYVPSARLLAILNLSPGTRTSNAR